MKIEHIGIAVSNLNEANKLYSKLLGVEPYKTEVVDVEGVVTSFFQTNKTKIELLQGLRMTMLFPNLFKTEVRVFII